ncbi:MAG: hypothetical protein V1720_20110 [bacterium]
MKTKTCIKILLLASFLTCSFLLLSCSTTDPPTIIPEDKHDTLTINIVEESYKYIKVNVRNTANNANSLIRLIRKYGDNKFNIAQYPITVKDTTITDDYSGKGLEYGTEYSYYAVRIEGEKATDTSKTVTAKTREPVSHNYVWEEITIGEWQSVLYDVWGTDENNVYAVGSVKINGIGCGMLHFNGADWDTIAGVGGHAIFGFSANDIWSVASTVYHYDGTKWSKISDPIMYENISYHGVWGTNSNNLYLASGEGTIVHWNGQRATLMDVPTKIFLTDIFGINESLILACGNSLVFPSTVLKYNGQNWRLMNELELDTELYESVFVMSENEYYISGSKTLRYYNDKWTREIKDAIGTIHIIRGDRCTGQVVAAGSANTIWHFNGVDWYDFTNIAFKEYATIYGLYVTQNTIIVVGGTGSMAKISIGKLQ